MMRMNKDKRSANLIAVMLLTIMLSFPKEMKAQFAFDYTSIEAYISDHKSVRSLLMTRATLEYGNQLLHEYSQEKTEGYKDLNFELDRYTRAFDIIDIMYQSLRLGLNIYSTYDKVSERLYGYGDMLDRYNELVLKRGKPELADKRLLTINYEAIKKISAECDDLYKSVYDLILYATGAAACSTSDLMTVMERINTSLDRIREMVNSAYLSTWNYIQVRTGYWKSKIYRTRTIEEMAESAFERWRASGHKIKVN